MIIWKGNKTRDQQHYYEILESRNFSHAANANETFEICARIFEIQL